MSLALVIDMNLSPEWAGKLSQSGWTAVHWSAIGDPKSPDSAIMEWAIANRDVVFTHDLDFGAALAITHALGPSVLQVRGQNVLPQHMLRVILAALEQHKTALEMGALVVVEERKCRVRVLPLRTAEK